MQRLVGTFGSVLRRGLASRTVASAVELDGAIKEGGVVVVDFYADWCGPCKAAAPIYEQLSEQYSDASFLKVDTDAHPDAAQQHAVAALPTFKVFHQGQEQGTVVGANIPELTRLVKEATE